MSKRPIADVEGVEESKAQRVKLSPNEPEREPDSVNSVPTGFGEYGIVRQWNLGGNQMLMIVALTSSNKVAEQWLYKGKKHRVGAPADIHYENGQVEEEGWYKNGLLHRDDGPAITKYSSGAITSTEYYLEGVKYSFGRYNASPAVKAAKINKRVAMADVLGRHGVTANSQARRNILEFTGGSRKSRKEGNAMSADSLAQTTQLFNAGLMHTADKMQWERSTHMKELTNLVEQARIAGGSLEYMNYLHDIVDARAEENQRKLHVDAQDLHNHDQKLQKALGPNKQILHGGAVAKTSGSAQKRLAYASDRAQGLMENMHQKMNMDRDEHYDELVHAVAYGIRSGMPQEFNTMGASMVANRAMYNKRKNMTDEQELDAMAEMAPPEHEEEAKTAEQIWNDILRA